jgi:hypothetical protein
MRICHTGTQAGACLRGYDSARTGKGVGGISRGVVGCHHVGFIVCRRNVHAHTVADEKVVRGYSQIADAVRILPVFHIISFLGSSSIPQVCYRGRVARPGPVSGELWDAMAARIPMIAITIINSISVKPSFFLIIFVNIFLSSLTLTIFFWL